LSGEYLNATKAIVVQLGIGAKTIELQRSSSCEGSISVTQHESVVVLHQEIPDAVLRL
jgi:hypothetical protein